MTSGELSIIISPESLFNDMRSLFDSYALRVENADLVYLHTPLFHMPMYGGIGGPPLPPQPRAGNPIDHEAAAQAADWIANGIRFEPGYSVSLTQFQPTQDPEDSRPASNIYTRWPFFVDAPLRLMLVWKRTDHVTQWWQFDFEPGQQYTERRNP